MASIGWVGWLGEMLCRLFQAWGGDCVAMGDTAPEWVAAITGVYSASGAPSFPNSAARDQFLADLDALEAHLDEPENDLTDADEASLRQLIASLRADLGAG